MSKRFACSFIFLLFVTLCRSQDVQTYNANAKEAYANKDYEGYYANLAEANKLHPYHQVIWYRLGLASALTGRKEEAIKALTNALYIQADFDMEVEDLTAIKDTKEFKSLLNLQKSLKQPIITSDTAFIIPDRQAHIESVTYDKNTRSFYLSSIHKRKIIKRDPSGIISDFTQSGEHEMSSVFGLKVDAKNKLLWACASPMPEMINYDSTISSAVYKYDLLTGKFIDRYEAVHFEKSVFGDLTLNNSGEVFVSDGTNNVIFKVDEKSNTLLPFFQSDEFWNIQGISFSTDDQFLFISDYIKGLYRLEVKTKKLRRLSAQFEQSLKGIDGLSYYKGDLIAIQNGVIPLRVTLYTLNKAQDTLVGFKIIDRAHPAFNEPTIGTLVGDEFYYIANSQWGGYTESHAIKPETELQDAVILKANLKVHKR